MVDGKHKQSAPLPEIPLYDVGTNYPLELARLVGDRGYELLASATKGVPRPALRIADNVSRRWLERNKSPYLEEIRYLAEHAKAPGLYYLNVSYEWGCTSAGKPAANAETAVMARTLDWDVSGIGRYVLAARIANPLGAWVSLTWPAFTGVIQGLAPGRFAAAINQPQMPRRTRVRPVDWLLTLGERWTTPHTQPVHLLRCVFETAPDFATAREMLISTPIATPTIFTLVGTRPDETVVIERRETSARISPEPVAANEWVAADWHPGHYHAFENDARRAAMRRVRGQWDLDWAQWPLLNRETKLAMVAEPATGRLLARGYEAERPATQIFDRVIARNRSAPAA
jgi:hypothetical protein